MEPTERSLAPALIGRDHPLAVLTAELERTLTSHGSLVLVTGEAGIGKTTLAGEIATRARSRGAVVVSGAAWDKGGAPGYWPWIQVIRGLQRVADPQQWLAARQAAGQGMAFLLGEARELPGPRQLANEATFQVHDAVTNLLVSLARDRALVVMLDDLHWADPASIKLLEFVVRHAWFERLLLLATYRDAEIETGDHPLRPLVSQLLPRAVVVTLGGLDAGGVRSLLARASGAEPDEQQVAEIHQRTGGNPFFVEQAARLHASGGQLAAETPGVREALRARLALLPAGVTELLTNAAVAGREFELTLLAAVAGMPEPEVGSLLKNAITARLLTDLGAGRYAFIHDLVREALYSDLDEPDRRKRHAALVHGLERLPPDLQPAAAGALAHHAYLAVPVVDPATARDYLLAAAHEASRRLAAEEATTHLHRALHLADDQTVPWAEIALDLAWAQRAAGELVAARATVERVVAFGREQGHGELLARAILGLHDLGWQPDQPVDREIALLDEARTALAAAPAGDPVSIQTLAAASRARAHGAVDPEMLAAAQELSARAVELARGCGDDEALGLSLLARHDAIWRPGTAGERLALADEMVALAERSHDLALELQGRLLRVVGLLEQGDPRALTEHASFRDRAYRHYLPRWRFVALSRQGTVATLAGRFAEARAAVDAALAMGDRMGEVDRLPLWREQRWGLALLQGSFDEAQQYVEAFRGDSTVYAKLLAVVTSVELGEGAAGAEDAVQAVAESSHGTHAPTALRAWAQVAAASADRQWCRQAHAALAPLRGSWAVVSGGGIVHGPYAHWLAVLDAALERWDDAVAGFTEAWRAADRLAAAPWSVEARHQLAHALYARAATGDTAQAVRLLEQVAREAAELGMHHVAQRAQQAYDRFTAGQVEPGPVGPVGPAEPAEFRFDGRVWNLRYAGRTVHLPDAKGLRDLHVLLSQPSADIPASALLNPAGGEPVRAVGRLGADPVLDERARAEYRRRLAELDEQIDRAVSMHHDDRAAELDQEREALLGQLRAATGLAGRSRRLGDEGERARKTVTARIRHTLRRLDTEHPELAEHLRASVSTGVTCRYRPAREINWVL